MKSQPQNGRVVSFALIREKDLSSYVVEVMKDRKRFYASVIYYEISALLLFNSVDLCFCLTTLETRVCEAWVMRLTH